MPKLKTIAELKRSIGGRPVKEECKVRLSFYLTPSEAEHLRTTARLQSTSASSLVRSAVKNSLLDTDK